MITNTDPIDTGLSYSRRVYIDKGQSTGCGHKRQVYCSNQSVVVIDMLSSSRHPSRYTYCYLLLSAALYTLCIHKVWMGIPVYAPKALVICSRKVLVSFDVLTELKLLEPQRSLVIYKSRVGV